ncbi:uncharacterized protein FMAN_16004 [Fusarium mangiferae]|uniref:Uncharacterized protein n=1 Tax=Fusarium mangiferae TaxID=192010 RepID=A0A1L7U7K2_FUSMA|nr:uncharacterized protein FMAN_16004 [Fusarium mangiferae]CVL03481.1 uncharacterized protein FMAN_16004 [Fusarium mangiferae]
MSFRRTYTFAVGINEKPFEVWLSKACAAIKKFGKSHALICSEVKNMTTAEYADYRNAILQISKTQQHCERLGSLLIEIFLYEKDTHAQKVKRIRTGMEAECEGYSGLGTYVSDMELFGAAFWFWQLQGTKRYLSKTSPFKELRLGDVKSKAETSNDIYTCIR